MKRPVQQFAKQVLRDFAKRSGEDYKAMLEIYKQTPIMHRLGYILEVKAWNEEYDECERQRTEKRKDYDAKRATEELESGCERDDSSER